MLTDKQHPILGIIGGNGVATKSFLQEKIKNNFINAGAFRNSHLPQMLIFDFTLAPFPSL